MFQKYVINGARALWLLLSLVILAFLMHRLGELTDMRDISEIVGIMVLAMIIVCAPLSSAAFALIALIGLLSELCFPDGKSVITNKYLMLFLVWLPFFISGYVQWFVAVPRLFKKQPNAGISH